MGGPFDIILANPPYVTDVEWPMLPPKIRAWEPRLALIGGVDGLAAYRELLPAVARLLAPGGAGFSRSGRGQAPHVAALARRVGFQHIEINGSRRNRTMPAGSWRRRTGAKKSLGNQALPV